MLVAKKRGRRRTPRAREREKSTEAKPERPRPYQVRRWSMGGGIEPAVPRQQKRRRGPGARESRFGTAGEADSRGAAAHAGLGLGWGGGHGNRRPRGAGRRGGRSPVRWGCAGAASGSPQTGGPFPGNLILWWGVAWRMAPCVPVAATHQNRTLAASIHPPIHHPVWRVLVVVHYRNCEL